MFQQLLANKLHRLHDSKFGQEEVWVLSATKLKKKKNPVQSKNRARPMATQLISHFHKIYIYMVDKAKDCIM